ncbi:MAG TPA: Gfo/Idh/MocA family oxidoreductase [Mycobacteriales bacterium]|nr:Gfo/Idh/MocA family oxidoreductase [Mycobacteriales bacterium]
MTPPIRTAIVGYGLAGRVFHAPLLTTDPAFTLSAIVTSDPERSATARHAHPGARIVPDLDAVLAGGDIDLIVVAAPTPLHADLVQRTIEAGIATVVDKPLAVRSADAERLIDLARERSVPLTVFQNRRWDGDFLTVRRLVEQERLGEIWRFESHFEWLSARKRPAWKVDTPGVEGGGVAYDLGAHLIDQALQLFGPVRDVYGELDGRRPGAVNDDDTFIALSHESGVRSHLGMSSLVAQRAFRFRILGSEAAFTKWGLDQQEAQLTSGMAPTDEAYGVAAPETYGRLGSDQESVAVPTENGGYRQFYRQVAAALTGSGPLPVDPADALAGIRIIEQLHARG